jgi:hypothetical protein
MARDIEVVAKATQSKNIRFMIVLSSLDARVEHLSRHSLD